MILVLFLLWNSIPQDVFSNVSYSEALVQARERDLLLMIDFRSNWLANEGEKIWRNRLANPSLVALLASEFVLVAVDIDDDTGRQLRDQFSIKRLPVTLIIDPRTVDEVDRLKGYSDRDFLKRLELILKGESFAAHTSLAKREPQNIAAWYQYAVELKERDRSEQAFLAFTHVIELDSTEKTEFGTLARLHLALLETDKARDLQPLIDFVSNHEGTTAAIEGHQELANRRATLADPVSRELALKSSEYVLSHGRRSVWNLEQHAWLLSRCADDRESIEKALAFAEEATRMAPDNAWAQTTAAECLYRLGRKQDALAKAAYAVRIAPWLDRGWCEAVLKQMQSETAR